VGWDRGFTGYKLDSETRLLYARARMYSPSQGRFIERDPLGFVDGYSLYYAYFLPNSVDPTGLYKNPNDGDSCPTRSPKECRPPYDDALKKCNDTADSDTKIIKDAAKKAKAVAQDAYDLGVAGAQITADAAHKLTMMGCNQLLDPDPLKNNPAGYNTCRIGAGIARDAAISSAKTTFGAKQTIADKTADATELAATLVILANYKVCTDKALDGYKKCLAEK